MGDLHDSANTVLKMASFNAATASKPWVTYHRKNGFVLGGKLQCGHGFEAVGDKVHNVPVYIGRDASMRPRLRSRG